MSSQDSAVKILNEEIERNNRWIEICLSIKPKEVYVTNVQMWDASAHVFIKVPHLLTPVAYNKESVRFKILAHNDHLKHITPKGRRTTTDKTYTYEEIVEELVEKKFRHLPKEDVPLYLGYKFVDSSITKYMVKSN